MATYVTIHDWMLELGLTGSELLAYAVICSFGQDGKWFQGSASYLCRWMGTKRKATALESLSKLAEKGLVEKRERWDKGKKICDYRPVRVPVRKEYRTGTETVPHNNKESDSDKKEIYKERIVHLSVDEFLESHRR